MGEQSFPWRTEKLTESVLKIWPSTEYATNLTELIKGWPSVRIFSPSYFTKSIVSGLDYLFSPNFWSETHCLHRVHRVAGFLTEFVTEWISPNHCARGFSCHYCAHLHDRLTFLFKYKNFQTEFQFVSKLATRLIPARLSKEGGGWWSVGGPRLFPGHEVQHMAWKKCSVPGRKKYILSPCVHAPKWPPLGMLGMLNWDLQITQQGSPCNGDSVTGSISRGMAGFL